MFQVTKRITQFVWNSPRLLLNSTALSGRIRLLRKVNPAGAGFVSFDPNRPSAFTAIETGDVVTLDATGVVSSDSSTHFDVDNGVSSSSAEPQAFEFDGTTIVPDETIYDGLDGRQFSQACSATAAFAQGTGTVQINPAGAGWMNVSTDENNPTAIPANTPFFMRVQHPANVVFYATLICTF